MVAKERKTVHWPNASLLPANPSFCPGIVVIVDIKGKAALSVISTCEIRQDGVALKNGEVVIFMVDERGNAAIRIDGCEPGLFLNILGNVDTLPSVM